MYKSSIIMYPIVFDCIRLYHMGCHHVKSCQDGTDLAYFLQLQTRTTCIGLLECTCRFSFHCHPLRGLAHCVCVCVVGVSPRKIQASCVCTVTKSEWRVFFGLPDSPSLSLYLFSHASTADMFGKVPAVLGRTLNGHYFTREEDLGLVHTTGLSGICNARVTCVGRKRSMVCRFPADGEGGPPQSNWALQCCSCIGGKVALANACVYMRLCVCVVSRHKVLCLSLDHSVPFFAS